MTAGLISGSPGLSLSWRRLEWWGCALALFLQTSGLFPLLALGADDTLDPSEKSRLRLVVLPAYLITMIFLMRQPKQLVIAMRRTLPLCLLVLLAVASPAWSVTSSGTLRKVIALLFTVGLGYLLAIRFTPRQVLALVGMVLAVCMVLSIVFAVAVPSLGVMSGGMGVRGIFTHKNVLGWYSAVAVLVSAMMLKDGTVAPRWASLFLLGASLTCLVMSSSMTSALAIVTAGLFTLFYTALAKLRGLSRLLLVLVVIEATVLLAYGLSEFLVPLLDALGKDATLSGRVQLWELVDAQIAHRPLIGYAYQTFWTEANPAAWEIWSEIVWQAPHAHNGYRDVLLSFGLVGFVPFVVMVVRMLQQGAALHCRQPDGGWLWLNVLSVMFLVMNITESLILVQNEFLFILFTVATVMFALREPESAPASVGK